MSWPRPNKGILAISPESILLILFLSTARGIYFEETMKTPLEYPFLLSSNFINKKLPLTVLPLLKTRSMSFLSDNLYFLGNATREMSYIDMSIYQTVSRFLPFLLLFARTLLPNLDPDLVRKPCFFFLFFFFARYSVDFIELNTIIFLWTSQFLYF